MIANTSTVGASLLAKVVNDSVCLLGNLDVLEVFASRLAPTMRFYFNFKKDELISNLA